MNQNVVAGVVVGFMALVAVVALAAGVGGSTTTTGGSMSGTATRQDSAPMEAIQVALSEGRGAVTGTFESVGFSLFGINFGGSRYEVHVGLVAPPECIEQNEAGADVVIDSGVCGSLPGSGLVSGGGRTVDGVEWVIVRVDVPRQCFEVVSTGDAWPSDAAECREG